jgi:uncharacterized membrane protein YdbT with pleckstrin-like domain
VPAPTRSSLTARVRSWHPDEMVRDLMVDGEVIYALEQPEWRLVLLDQAALAGLGVVVALLAAAVLGVGVGFFVFVVLAAVVSWRALDAWHTRYVLTSFRVVRFSGVLDRNVEFIPWRKVTDVSLHRSFWERLVGASTIRIESANERSRFREMKDVRNPRGFFATLQEITAAYSGNVDVAISPVDFGWDD